MDEVIKTLYIKDSTIGVNLVEYDDKGITMRIKIYDMTKFLGLTVIAGIINKVLKKYNTKLKGLSL